MPDSKLAAELLKRYFLPKIGGVGEAPLPPSATPFIPSPLVVGGGAPNAQMVEKLFRQFPDMKRTVKQVDFLPNAYMMERLNKSGLGVNDWDGTNLMGTTHLKTNKVNIYNPEDAETTLVHEFAHTRGAGEKEAEDVAGLYQTLLKQKDINLPTSSGKIDPRLRKKVR